MAVTSNLTKGQRAKREKLITVAQWGTGNDKKRQFLGVRTEDSSIDLNPDIQTSTDILGHTYTDVEKTEPQQTMDPSYIVGGSYLHDYLTEAFLANDIDKYNGAFDIYIISAYLTDGTATTGDGKYYTVKHEGCSIFPTSVGGSNYVSMPIEIHYSNKITKGTVDALKPGFTFTYTDSSGSSATDTWTDPDED